MHDKSTLRDLSRRPLYEIVAEEIRRHIIQAGLKEGDRIPSEHDLCEQLSVGRTSLREALRFLQMMGLIEIRVGRGIYVRRVDVDSFLDKTIKPVIDVTSEMEDLFEVREILEVAVVELAAKRRTEEQLEQMFEQLESDRKRAELGSHRAEDAIHFHQSLFEASQNAVLASLVNVVAELIRYRENPQPGREAAMRDLAEHTSIYEAVRDRMAPDAVRAMRNHLRKAAENIRARRELSKDGQPAAGSAKGIFAGN